MTPESGGKGGRRRPLSPDAARLYTALKRNALERRALDAQRNQLMRAAILAGLRYRDIADACEVSVGAAHRLAHIEAIGEEP